MRFQPSLERRERRYVFTSFSGVEVEEATCKRKDLWGYGLYGFSTRCSRMGWMYAGEGVGVLGVGGKVSVEGEGEGERDDGPATLAGSVTTRRLG